MKMAKGYWTIWTATLLFFAAFYTLMIPLPLYLTGVGLPDWQVGVVLGALGVTSLLVRPLAGVLADSWGRQKVMLFGTGALVVGAVGVSLTTQPVLLFGLRMLQAAGYVTFTTAATALISDLAAPQKRASALALFGTAANVAMTLTPATVNAMLDSLTLAGAFWLSGILALIGGGLALRVRPQTPLQKQTFNWGNLLVVFRKLQFPLAAAVLFGVGFGAFFQFLPLLVERRSLGLAGLVYTVYGVSIILTRLATGRLLDRANQTATMIISFLLTALGLSGLAFAAAQWQLLAATIFIAVGGGILHPLLIAIHVENVSAAERGRASAVFYLGFDLGIGLGAWILAPVFQWFGLTGLFLLAAILALAGILPVWFITPLNRKVTLPAPADAQ